MCRWSLPQSRRQHLSHRNRQRRGDAAAATRPVERHALAPDGRTLYVSSGFDPRAAVVALNLRTGIERPLRDLPRTVNALKVSRDGRTLAIVMFDAVEFVNLSSEKTTLRIDGSAARAQFWGGDWTPDGKRFFVAASYGRVHPRGELWTILMDGGETVRHPLKTPVRSVSVRPDGRELSMVRWEERQQVWIVENFLPASEKSAR